MKTKNGASHRQQEQQKKHQRRHSFGTDDTTQSSTGSSSETDGKRQDNKRQVHFSCHSPTIYTLPPRPSYLWWTRQELHKIQQRDALLLKLVQHHQFVETSTHSVRGLHEGLFWNGNFASIRIMEQQYTHTPVQLARTSRYGSAADRNDAMRRAQGDAAYALALRWQMLLWESFVCLFLVVVVVVVEHALSENMLFPGRISCCSQPLWNALYTHTQINTQVYLIFVAYIHTQAIYLFCSIGACSSFFCYRNRFVDVFQSI